MVLCSIHFNLSTAPSGTLSSSVSPTRPLPLNQNTPSWGGAPWEGASGEAVGGPSSERTRSLLQSLLPIMKWTLFGYLDLIFLKSASVIRSNPPRSTESPPNTTWESSARVMSEGSFGFSRLRTEERSMNLLKKLMSPSTSEKYETR